MTKIEKSLRKLATKCTEVGTPIEGKTAGDIIDVMADNWAGGGGGGETEIAYIDFIPNEEEETITTQYNGNAIDLDGMFALVNARKTLIGRIKATDGEDYNYPCVETIDTETYRGIKFERVAGIVDESYIVNDDGNTFSATDILADIPQIYPVDVVDDASAPKGLALVGWTYADIVQLLIQRNLVVAVYGGNLYYCTALSNTLKFSSIDTDDGVPYIKVLYVDDEDVVELKNYALEQK